MFLISLLLFFAAFLSFIISSVCGGGASMILIPALGLVLPAAQVPAALSLGTASSSISRVAVLWKNIRWDIVKWFIPPALPTVWLGARLLTYVNPVWLQLILGLFLLWNITFLFKKQNQDRTTAAPNHTLIFFIGLATGFVSGLTGAVGLIFNRFYLSSGLSNQEIVATRAANEVILHLIKLGLYASFGLLTAQTLSYGGVIALAGITASIGIKYILPLISARLFQKIGFSAMVISGCVLSYNAINELRTESNFNMYLSPVSGGMETTVHWKKSNFKLEFEYDEGFEIERKIAFKDLPRDLKALAAVYIKAADSYLIEEVHGFRKHYYEVYTWHQGKFNKYDLKMSR